jgi:hypothetical protein
MKVLGEGSAQVICFEPGEELSEILCSRYHQLKV